MEEFAIAKEITAPDSSSATNKTLIAARSFLYPWWNIQPALKELKEYPVLPHIEPQGIHSANREKPELPETSNRWHSRPLRAAKG